MPQGCSFRPLAGLKPGSLVLWSASHSPPIRRVNCSFWVCSLRGVFRSLSARLSAAWAYMRTGIHSGCRPFSRCGGLKTRSKPGKCRTAMTPFTCRKSRTPRAIWISMTLWSARMASRSSVRHCSTVLARLVKRHSFQPIWRPPFISKLAAEDRCHLNGLAGKDGEPAYVTMVSRSDAVDGWRDRRTDGGLVMDVASGEVVANGLSHGRTRPASWGIGFTC